MSVLLKLQQLTKTCLQYRHGVADDLTWQAFLDALDNARADPNYDVVDAFECIRSRDPFYYDRRGG